MQDNEAQIHLRVPAETKARWVRKSREEGKKLTDWIVEKVEAGSNQANAIGNNEKQDQSNAHD